MISAIITELGDARGLEATLAALAPAAIDGLVREVLALDVGASQAALDVAEDAGARAISAGNAAEGLAAACAAARGPWLLILPAGARLESRWEPAARRHIERYPGHAGWFALARDADGAGARLAEAMAAIQAGWLGRPRAGQGLLVSKARYEAVAGEAGALDHARLVRLLAGTLRPLGARALG